MKGAAITAATQFWPRPKRNETILACGLLSSLAFRPAAARGHLQAIEIPLSVIASHVPNAIGQTDKRALFATGHFAISSERPLRLPTALLNRSSLGRWKTRPATLRPVFLTCKSLPG